MPKVTNKERQRCWRYRTFLGGNKMSEADELLREEGYAPINNGEAYCDEDGTKIYFYKDTFGFSKQYENGTNTYVSTRELKAIVAKLKELGME